MEIREPMAYLTLEKTLIDMKKVPFLKASKNGGQHIFILELFTTRKTPSNIDFFEVFYCYKIGKIYQKNLCSTSMIGSGGPNGFSL